MADVMNRNGYQNSDFGVVRWVHQEDPRGCWCASMAMITGKTYAEVKAETGRMAQNGGHCWATDQYLTESGFVIQRYWQYDQFRGFADGEVWRNQKREQWPIEPFAPVHVCMVQTSTQHMVVMLADGTVLDPLTPESKRLSDYSAVHKVAGIWRQYPIFIANAKQDVPALCDTVEALRAENAALRQRAEAADAETNRLRDLLKAAETWRRAYQDAKYRMYSMRGAWADYAMTYMPCSEGPLERAIDAALGSDTAKQLRAEAFERHERLDAKFIETWPNADDRLIVERNHTALAATPAPEQPSETEVRGE